MSYYKILKLAIRFEEILKDAHDDWMPPRKHRELKELPKAEIHGLKHLEDLLELPEEASKEMPKTKLKLKNPYSELLGKYDEDNADAEEPELEDEEELDLLGI